MAPPNLAGLQWTSGYNRCRYRWEIKTYLRRSIVMHSLHGVGATSAVAAQAAEHTPKAALHAMIAGGAPSPAVTVPKTNPAPA